MSQTWPIPPPSSPSDLSLALGCRHFAQGNSSARAAPAPGRSTGVVGAQRGRIRRGLSSLRPFPVKSLLSRLRQGSSKALKLATRGVKRVGALAQAASGAVRRAGAASVRFFNSPQGRLLSTALSLAVTFVPGGVAIKAGLGALSGGIEALAKGGGLKQVLMGAAAGALEGVIPAGSFGALAKLALGGGKGALFAAASGGSAGDVLTGAMAGAVGAGSAVKAARRLSRVGGLQKIDAFFSGSRRYSRGALGKLQSRLASKRGQKIWRKVQKRARHSLHGAAWRLDKGRKVATTLVRARAVLEIGQGVSDASAWLAGSAAQRLADGHLRRLLLGVESAALGLGQGIDWADDGAMAILLRTKRLNAQLPLLITLLGDHSSASRAIRARKQWEGRRRKILRHQKTASTSTSPSSHPSGSPPSGSLSPPVKSKGQTGPTKLSKRAQRDLKRTDIYARIDDFVEQSLSPIEAFRSRAERFRLKSQQQLLRLPGAAKMSAHSKALRARLAPIGTELQSRLPQLAQRLEQGRDGAKLLRDSLRHTLLALEDVDGRPDPSLQWLHDFASKWEERANNSYRILRAGHGITATSQAALSALPKLDSAFHTQLENSRRAPPSSHSLSKSADSGSPAPSPASSDSPASSLSSGPSLPADFSTPPTSPPPLALERKRKRALEHFGKARRELAQRMEELSQRHLNTPKSGADPNAGFRALTQLGGASLPEYYRSKDWALRQERQEGRSADEQETSRSSAFGTPDSHADKAEIQRESWKDSDASSKIKPIGSSSQSDARTGEHLLLNPPRTQPTDPQHSPLLAPQPGLDGGPGSVSDPDSRSDSSPYPLADPITDSHSDSLSAPINDPITAPITDPIRGRGLDTVPEDERSQSLYEALSRYAALVAELRANAQAGLAGALNSEQEDGLEERLNQAEAELATRFQAALEAEKEEAVLFALEAGRAFRLLLSRRRKALRQGLQAPRLQIQKVQTQGMRAPEMPTPEMQTLESGQAGVQAPNFQSSVTQRADGQEPDSQEKAEAPPLPHAPLRPIGEAAAQAVPEWEDSTGVLDPSPHFPAEQTHLAPPTSDSGLPITSAASAEDFGRFSNDENGNKERAAEGVERTTPENGEGDEAPEGSEFEDKNDSEVESEIPAFGKAIGRLFKSSRRPRRGRVQARRPKTVRLDRPRQLDLGVLLQMESFLGQKLPQVFIHTDKRAAQLTRALHADAATVGQHIFFAPGTYQPQTREGQRLLVHELTHVLQRRRPNLSTDEAEDEAHAQEARLDAGGLEWPNWSSAPFSGAKIEGRPFFPAHAFQANQPKPPRIHRTPSDGPSSPPPLPMPTLELRPQPQAPAPLRTALRQRRVDAQMGKQTTGLGQGEDFDDDKLLDQLVNEIARLMHDDLRELRWA